MPALTSGASEDLPRERLEKHGAAALKDNELLAILFRTGVPGCNALEMSQALLDRYGGLKNLSRATVPELTGAGNDDSSVKGIGSAKAVTLLAALELGKRAALAHEPKLDLKRTLCEWARDLEFEEREFIIAIYLDKRDRPIARGERLSYGGPDGASLDAPYLFRQAVRIGCSSLVLMHNHPDGCLEASGDDRRLTDYIAKRLEFLDIGFYGHYIIAGRHVRRIPNDGGFGKDVFAPGEDQKCSPRCGEL